MWAGKKLTEKRLERVGKRLDDAELLSLSRKAAYAFDMIREY